MTVEVSPKGKDYDALVRHFYKNAMTDWDVANLCEALDGAVKHERETTIERIRHLVLNSETEAYLFTQREANESNGGIAMKALLAILEEVKS